MTVKQGWNSRGVFEVHKWIFESSNRGCLRRNQNTKGMFEKRRSCSEEMKREREMVKGEKRCFCQGMSKIKANDVLNKQI